MEATMISEKRGVADANVQTLVEIFDQISVYNEIGFQTVRIALSGAFEKIKNPENQAALFNAMEQVNIMLDRCRTASDKIDRLSRSGTIVARKIFKEELVEY